MTDQSSGQYTPAGWYPDPSGAHQQRWWDGSHWSESTQPFPVAAGTSPVSPYGSHAVTAPRSNADPSTRAVWVLAMLPLAVVLSTIITLFFDSVYTNSDWLESSESRDVTQWIIGFLPYLITFSVWIGGAFIARADRNALLAKGIVSPFSWAWAFIPILHPLTYLIGRTVVVRAQTGRGFAPLITWIGLTVGSSFINAIIAVAFAWTLN